MISYLVTVKITNICRNEEEQRVEFIVANGEINENGTGFYVLSADRVGRAQWFVKNFSGYPARNPQTKLFSWPFAPAGESIKESDIVSTANCLRENERKQLYEMDAQLDTCKELVKTIDEKWCDYI
jgi:hypothetical protein